MLKIGKYLKKHFMDKKVELFTGENSEWVHYRDNDSMSLMLIVGTVKGYDEECGVLKMESETGHMMYINEHNLVMFWEADKGFNILRTTASTIRTGKKFQNRDIMRKK